MMSTTGRGLIVRFGLYYLITGLAVGIATAISSQYVVPVLTALWVALIWPVVIATTSFQTIGYLILPVVVVMIGFFERRFRLSK